MRFSPSPMPERAAPAWLTQWEYAHRGLHASGVPENSPSAFRAAIAAGMGIECDIQRSADDQPMVFHDWELSRLTGTEGLTASLSAADFGQLCLLGTDDHPQHLAEMLALVAGQVPILIEIKSLPDYDIAPSCAAVSAALEGYQGEHAVMSFDPRVGEWFAAHDPQVVRGLVCTDTLDHGWLRAWRADGAIARAAPDFLACDIRDLPGDLASAWRDAGRPLLSWTIKTPELRARGLAHVDALISEGAGLAEVPAA